MNHSPPGSSVHEIFQARMLEWKKKKKNAGVGCHFLLQGVLLTQGLNPRLLDWQADSQPQSHQQSLMRTHQVWAWQQTAWQGKGDSWEWGLRGFSFLLFKTRTEFLSESLTFPQIEKTSSRSGVLVNLVLCSKSIQTECFHTRVINYFSGSHDLSLRLGPGTWNPSLQRLHLDKCLLEEQNTKKLWWFWRRKGYQLSILA